MELGQRFVVGTEAELEELIDEFGEKLLRYATSILYNHQDAEDAVQDVFLSAYKNRAAFDGKNISAWLYRITYNQCIDKLKWRKRRKLFFFNDVKEEPRTFMEDSLAMPEIMEALSQLKPKERALLYGRIMSGHSYEELSQIMDSTPAALRKQYERVKKKAAKYLRAYGYADAEPLQTPGTFNVYSKNMRERSRI